MSNEQNPIATLLLGICENASAATPPTPAAKALTSSDWVEALAKQWDREVAEKTSGSSDYDEALRNCAFEMRLAALRAEGESTSTDPSSPTESA